MATVLKLLPPFVIPANAGISRPDHDPCGRHTAHRSLGQLLDHRVVQHPVRGDGTGPGNTDGKGHGIIGMNERATAFGGTVYTGAIEGGGFRVIASIPLEKRSL